MDVAEKSQTSRKSACRKRFLRSLKNEVLLSTYLQISVIQNLLQRYYIFYNVFVVVVVREFSI